MSVRAFLCQWNFTHENPSVSRRAGRRQLADLFFKLGHRRGAEIGVWDGAFSEQLCRMNPGVALTCVDPWESYEEYRDPKNDARRIDAAYQAAVQRLAPYDCTIVRKRSVEAAASVPDGSLDFVFIDGNHGEHFVTDDLHAWAPKVRSGGIVSGHDYMPSKGKHKHLEVKPAVDRYVTTHGIDRLYVLGGDPSASFFWVAA